MTLKHVPVIVVVVVVVVVVDFSMEHTSCLRSHLTCNFKVISALMVS